MIRIRDAARRLKESWDCFYEARRRPGACPECRASRVWWNGSPSRAASALVDGAVCHFRDVRCRRAKCRSCGNRWVVRPPGISPNRHYQLCVVAHAVSGYLFGERVTQAKVAQEHDCSERTVGRWLRWAGQVASPVALQREILEASGPILPAIPAVANLARKARTAVRRQIVTRAAQILSLLEALGMARCLEPPGLRGVIERVLRDRATIATYARPLIPDFAR